MDSIAPKLTEAKFAQAPPGIQNIVIVWNGSDIISIGYGEPFNVWFIYEGGGGQTSVQIQIDNGQFTPLQPGQYNYSVNSNLNLQANVNNANPAKFGWVFQ